MTSQPATFDSTTTPPATTETNSQSQGLVVKIVGAAAFAHLLNDLIQAMLPAVFPMLKTQYALSFAQIGWIALVYQTTASLLQPWLGLYTDKYPKPFLLPAGMVVTLIGVGMMAFSNQYEMLLVAAAVVGVGSATFHPEAARVSRMASGGRFGIAQSTFQVGGNTGSAIGPLLVATLVIPYGQTAIAWFMLAALAAVPILIHLTRWAVQHGQSKLKTLARKHQVTLTRGQVTRALVVICVLMFAKFVYIASFTNYYTFYLIERFGLGVSQSQICLFIFLASVAIGTFFGGPVGDRIGHKKVIWLSFAAVAPFSLALPYTGLYMTAVLTVVIGLILSSALPALLVYAQEAVPGRVGMVSGIMFGLMFGVSGIGAAALGSLADIHGIVWVYKFTSFLPLIGLVTFFLPRTQV